MGNQFFSCTPEYLYLVENLLPIPDQCIRHMTVVCCLYTRGRGKSSDLGNLSFTWKELHVYRGHGVRPKKHLKNVIFKYEYISHYLSEEKSQVINIHPIGRFCHPPQVHHQHFKGCIHHWTIDLVQHYLHFAWWSTLGCIILAIQWHPLSDPDPLQQLNSYYAILGLLSLSVLAKLRSL